jgi:predicted ester cyclase
MCIFKKGILVSSLFFILIGVNVASAKTDIPDSNLIKPLSMTIDHSLSKKKADELIHATRLLYTFWNTGDAKYLDAVVSPKFIDNTLPKGRPQGPSGIKFASANFRKAVPDLQCSLKDVLIVGDKVAARMVFTGTFKGEFMGHAPTNEPIEFFAIDILHIKNGKLIEDWHLEDNLTLLQQLNAVKMQ